MFLHNWFVWQFLNIKNTSRIRLGLLNLVPLSMIFFIFLRYGDPKEHLTPLQSKTAIIIQVRNSASASVELGRLIRTGFESPYLLISNRYRPECSDMLQEFALLELAWLKPQEVSSASLILSLISLLYCWYISQRAKPTQFTVWWHDLKNINKRA